MYLVEFKTDESKSWNDKINEFKRELDSISGKGICKKRFVDSDKVSPNTVILITKLTFKEYEKLSLKHKIKIFKRVSLSEYLKQNRDFFMDYFIVNIKNKRYLINQFDNEVYEDGEISKKNISDFLSKNILNITTFRGYVEFILY